MAKDVLRIADVRPVGASAVGVAEGAETVFTVGVGAPVTGRRFQEIRLEGVSLRSPVEVRRFAAWLDDLACRLDEPG